MGNNMLTFNQFFDMNEETESKAKQLLKSEKFQSLKEKIAGEAKGAKLSEGFYEGMFELMLTKLTEMLAIDIPKDVFAQAWSKHKSLQEYRDTEKHPPDKAAFVPLVEHTVKTAHKPSMELTIWEKTLGTLELAIDASFLIKGAVLEIKDGKIMKINLSNIEAKGNLKFLGLPFLEMKRSLSLPGIFDLKEGVAIRDPFEKKKKEEAKQEEEKPAEAALTQEGESTAQAATATPSQETKPAS
jgi:hypothetical protein